MRFPQPGFSTPWAPLCASVYSFPRASEEVGIVRYLPHTNPDCGHAETRMIARYRMYLFSTLFLLTILAGCKVDSINPISSSESAQPDVTLYGVWRYKAKGEVTYVHIG